MAGDAGNPRATASDNPVLGSFINIDLENSLGVATPGFLPLGLGSASIKTNLGGTLPCADSRYFSRRWRSTREHRTA